MSPLLCRLLYDSLSPILRTVCIFRKQNTYTAPPFSLLFRAYSNAAPYTCTFSFNVPNLKIFLIDKHSGSVYKIFHSSKERGVPRFLQSLQTRKTLMPEHAISIQSDPLKNRAARIGSRCGGRTEGMLKG